MSDVLTAEEVSAILPDSGPWREEYIVALARSHEQLRGRLSESEIAVYDALALLGEARNERDGAVRERDEARAALAEREQAENGATEDPYGVVDAPASTTPPRSANADPAAAAIDALRLADELAERYGAYWRKDSAYYAYIDARAAVDAYKTAVLDHTPAAADEERA